jgi:hypothetical protein
MIAALLAAVLTLLASWMDQPAPAVQTPPAPAVVAPTATPGALPVRPPALPLLRQPEEAPPTVDPACAVGEEWDGLRCVALQLPDEALGRQYDPAD